MFLSGIQFAPPHLSSANIIIITIRIFENKESNNFKEKYLLHKMEADSIPRENENWTLFIEGN